MEMATLTIRNIPPRVVRRLKALAKQQNASMEQLVRDLLEEHTADRASVLKQIEASAKRGPRRPGAAEIDDWIRVGRDM